MKKTFLFFTFLLCIVLLFPFVGNTIVKENIDNKIALLNSYGVDVKTHRDSVGYLYTHKEYELIVKDSRKFATYLNRFYSRNSHVYTQEMFDGVRVGVNVEYSNIPFDDGVSLDLYPLSLSLSSMKMIEEYDKKFYLYFKKLLQSRAILANLNYSIVKSSFNGYVKNIDEEYQLQDNSKISLKVVDATYSGSGFLGLLERFDYVVDKFSFTLSGDDEKYVLKFLNLATFTNFESDTTYNYVLNLQHLEVDSQTKNEGSFLIDINDTYFDISSNTQGKKADIYSKSSFATLLLETNATYVKCDGFNYDIALNGVDKDSYEQLHSLVSQSNFEYPDVALLKFEKNILNIFSRGINLKIADFSLDKISGSSSSTIDGFRIKSDLVITKDLRMAEDILSFSSLIYKNITLDSSILVSKDLFGVINREFPVGIFAMIYAKEKDNSILFDILYKDQKLIVNGKELY